MRIKLIVLFLAVASVGAAFYMLNKSPKAELEARFDRISAHINKQASKWGESGANAGDQSLNQDYRALVNHIWKSRDNKQRRLYRSLLLSELKSPKPVYRALACELLGEGFDVALIPEIGKLLDDSAKAIPQYYPAPLHQQQITSTKASRGSVRMAAVREFANRSLYSLTGQSFYLRREFDAWWRENSNYRNTTWYWSRRWEPMNGSRVGVAQRIADISTLSDDAALRAVILSGVSWNDDVSRDQLPKFLQKRHLKSRIIGMLHQKDLLPEINSQERFDYLVREISELSQCIFTPEDEPLIASAENVRSPYKPPVADLVLLRVNIVLPPNGQDRAVKIMVEALRKDPTLVPVAEELIGFSSLKEAAVIKRAFQSVSGYEKHDIARAVANNPNLTTPAFVRELVQLVPDPSDDYCDAGLGYLSKAANLALHREVISKQDIAIVEWSPGKTSTRDEWSQASKCFAQVKQRLLQVLARAR